MDTDNQTSVSIYPETDELWFPEDFASAEEENAFFAELQAEFEAFKESSPDNSNFTEEEQTQNF